MLKRTQKLLAVPATVGSVAIAAAAGAVMPDTMVPWAIMGGTCLLWIAGLTIGLFFGSASGWSFWALGAVLGAAIATTGLLPYRSLTFAGAALLVSTAAVLSAKAVSDAIDARHNQH